MLPGTIFIGPTRSGSTWIDAYLRARGDVLLPARTKETYFFDKRYDNGLAWYEAQFGTPGATRACVEVAPSLFHKAPAAARVAADLPGVRVIAMLRDPAERAVSHYFHYRRAGEPALTLAAMASRKADLVEAGLYHKHLSRWRALLGPERVHVLLYSDLQQDTAAFCTKLCALLDLPYVPPVPDLLEGSTNSASVPRSAWAARIVFGVTGALRRSGADRVVNAFKSEALKRLVYGDGVSAVERRRVQAQAAALRAVFRHDVEQLESLLGIDLAAWK